MTKYTDQGKQDTRSGYGAGMTELGRTNPNVVALCADLVGSLKIDTFIEEDPSAPPEYTKTVNFDLVRL